MHEWATGFLWKEEGIFGVSTEASTKEERVLARKRKITGALKRLLQKHVYSQISIQEIADEAGYSKGGVLHYFQSKDDIYIELINELYAELDYNHRRLISIDMDAAERAPISSLLSVESFLLDKVNVTILINIILYAFENETVMAMMKKSIANHRMFFESIMKDAKRNPGGTADIDNKTVARIIQVIVFFIGLIEEFDPIDLDYTKIVKYFTRLMKN